IASISPTSTSSLEGTLLTISGGGFASQTAGLTTVEIGGMPALNITVISDNTITCTVPSGTPGTSVDVVVSNDNTTAALPGALRYHDLPTLAFMSPDSGSGLGGTSVFLFGTGFVVDAAGTPTITFAGVGASGITVLDNTSILCQAPPGTAGALVDVVLNNANGQASLIGAFQYDAPAPTLASISPAEGPPVGGTPVALTGTGFLAHDPGATNVLFGNTPGSNVQVTSDTQLTVTSPSGPAGVSVDVTVLNQNGAATLAGAFQYRDGVTVAGVLPANGRSTGGEAITINGAGFASPTAGITSVLFGSIPALDLFIMSDSIMTVTAPSGTSGTSVDVVVSNDNGTSTLSGGYRYNAAPAISSLLPASGRSLGDTFITILGSGFLIDGAGLNTVTIGGLPATEIAALADDTLVCKAPAGTPGATADVSIINANGQAFMPAGYRYHALPSLAALSPTSDSSGGGILVTLQGTGFLADNPGTTVLTFGGVQATNVTALTDEVLTCLAPPGTPGAVVDISLSNENGSASLLGAFRYHALPELISLSLSEGSSLGGDFLSLLGQGFQNDAAGPATVAFDGVMASGVTVLTDTELICSTPSGSAGALVEVVLSNANGDASLAGAFRYNDRPTIGSVSPPNGSLNGSTFVTITGTGFLLFNAGSNLVTFDGAPATSVSLIDDTTITCLSPPGAGGTTAAIGVSNANGEALFLNAFTYDDGPTITSILPASGTTEGGTSVLVFGRGFQNASSGPLSVTFGGLPATNIQILADTAILCDTPTSNPGPVDVVVSNDIGQAVFPAAFTYIAPAPTLDSISPASGTSLGDTLITLMGSGFSNYLPGENTILIGDLPATDVSLLSDFSLTCRAPAAAPGSFADVRLMNDNGSAEIVAAFRYHSLPVLNSASPADGTALGGTNVTLIGTGFAIDNPGLPGVSFDGIPATSVAVIDDSFLTCLAPAGLAGAIVDIRIENANGATALASGFRYHTPPTIDSISPESSSSLGGGTLLLLGTGFQNDSAGIPAITIGANLITELTVLDDTRITLIVPPGSAGSLTSVALSNFNGTVQLVDSFRYHDLPTLTSVSPASGSPDGGETLVIGGSGFQKDFAGANTVLIDGVPALSVTVIDDLTLNCTTPPGPPGTFVEVRLANTNGEVGLATAYRYHGRPVIASLDPASGPSLGGATVTITGGAFLDDDAGVNTVHFGGVPANDVTVLSDTTLTVVAPSGSPGSSVDVMIGNNNGQAVLLSGYRFHGEPTLVSLSPTSGASAGNIPVTVNGSGFLVDSPGLNNLSFGGSPATGLVILDDSTLTCMLPPGAEGTTVDLALLNDNGGDILSSAFTYNMPSPLASIVPASGSSLGGMTVTLLGSAFTAPGTGVNTVFFGGIPADDVVTVNDSTITATIPPHTAGTSVDVTLRNGNGERSLVAGFFYYPTPTLSAITPTSGSALGGTGVLVFGTGFLNNNAGTLSVTFDGVPATSINIFSDTAFLSEAPPGQPDSPVSIQVANGNGSATLIDAYQYTAPEPTLFAVTPPTGSPLGGTLVTIEGTGFQDFAPGANLVTFGGVLATNVVVVDDRTLTCMAPTGPAGDVVDLRIQNDNGTHLLINAFRFNLPPALTSISPASGTSIGSTVINISGLGFLDQNPGSTTVTIGGLPAANVVIVDDTMLTCVAPAGSAGTNVGVTVANVNGSDTLNSAFRYHDLPTMTAVSPNHGSAMGGDSVTLTGTGYQIDAAGPNDVTFDGAPATDVLVVNDTTITCTTPAGIAGGFATVQISNANGTVAMPIAFRFHAQPVLTSASPTTGRSSGGTTLLLFGTGFMADDAGSNAVSLDGNPATNIMVFSDSALLCDTPQGVRDEVADIVITNANGSSILADAFTYTASTPVLTSITPQSGSFLGGTALTLKGKDFLDSTRGITTITIGGQTAANLVIVDGETITVDAPAGTPDTLVDVVVTNDNGTDSLLGAFRYAPMPTLTVLLPDNGSADGGDSVLLSGSGFTSDGAGMNTVTFDGLLATNILVLDDATISCLTPESSAAGLVNVAVANTNGTAILAGGFEYRMPPTLLSLSKLSGTSLGGDSMTLTGVNFSAAGAGATQVLFGNLPATDVVVVDDTAITCTIPAGVGGSQIEVQVVNTNGGSALASAYRYHDLPTLAGLTPSQGTMMGGTSIAIAGTGFLVDSPGPATVSFGASEATNVLVLDDANLTCLLPAGMPGALADVTVSNSNGAATLVGAFSYFPPPTLISITPSS
ncbi:MAG: hypothetical protein CMJ89_15495, partial [Planctomycetes bacterium]|nr:hypothetical protein [Planctomycetota bacterium]